VIDYCRTSMAFEGQKLPGPVPVKKNGLIADEVQGSGTSIHTQSIRAKSCAARWNFDGDSDRLAPSSVEAIDALDPGRQDDADIVATPNHWASPAHDHIIVGRDGHASVKGMRLI
jgi:hypothetical protein